MCTRQTKFILTTGKPTLGDLNCETFQIEYVDGGGGNNLAQVIAFADFLPRLPLQSHLLLWSHLPMSLEMAAPA